ncbi:MAG: redoxin family protein [Myxococcales bacterium]|nr:redoxin family protein [Myxococcales bacterium]
MAFSRRALVAATVACLAGGCAAMGGAVPARLSPDRLPTLARVVDGAPVSLAEIVRAHDATVLVWWASRCPCVKRYQRRIDDLARRFGGRRTAVLMVASNADDDRATLRRALVARRVAVPLLFDRGGRLARALGVETTPTTVALDKHGRVAFHGWIDNERTLGASGRKAYAVGAVSALLAGLPVGTPRTPVYGCRITRALGEPQRCHHAVDHRETGTACTERR